MRDVSAVLFLGQWRLAAGHVASIASSNARGASMSYTYDALNLLTTVVDNRLSIGLNTTTYTYDEANNVATVTYPNGVMSTFAYDMLNRVSGLTSPVSSYAYQRGATGNLTGETDANGRQAVWSYDGINRLTGEAISLDPARNNGTVSYGLDPVGNRLRAASSITALSSGTFSFNSDDQLTSESYDQNGNVIAATGKTFAYDSQNQLVSMNNGAVRVIYDGDGNRVAKIANGVTTQYLVDALNPTGYPQVIEELTNGVVSRTYAYGVQRNSESQTVNGAWTTSYYGYDGGGNVRELTNTQGTVADAWDYDSFGNVLNQTGSTPNEMLYRGEQYDIDLSLYYLRARYYNPIRGRFLSRDPKNDGMTDPIMLHKYLNSDADQEVSFFLFGGGPESIPVSYATQSFQSLSLSDENVRNPQEQHKYAYANNDPVSQIDPSGRDAMIEFYLEKSDIPAEEEGLEVERCAEARALCLSGCYLAVSSAGIHGHDAFGDTRACIRRCMEAVRCENF